ncbi:hypothetical protein Dimus_002629 [Dionaea muscipula]
MSKSAGITVQGDDDKFEGDTGEGDNRGQRQWRLDDSDNRDVVLLEHPQGSLKSILRRSSSALGEDPLNCFCTANNFFGAILGYIAAVGRTSFTHTADMDHMYFNGYGYHGASFEQAYRCYPASFIEKPQIETGDKIIMPPSALDRLASLHIDYPMMFELRNDAASRISHCGVLEFTADEGMIFVPNWMMENMLLQEGDIVRVKNVALPKGKYVKLQPHTKDFLDISNPKAILETTLRNFSCFTTGDSIMVAYNKKKYYIDIVETKPSNAVSIIETDCEVDFAPPLDYKEPEKPAVSGPSKSAAQVEDLAETEPKFSPFSGAGRRLDGKPGNYQPTMASSSSKERHPGAADADDGKQSASASSSRGASRQTQGKLVFGSNVNKAPNESPKEPAKGSKQQQQQPKKEEPKFHPFTGKKYSLKG